MITETYQVFVNEDPEKIAVTTSTEKISYSQWHTWTNQTAHWLKSMQNEYKTVGILLPNNRHFLQVFLGAAKAGWVAVPYDVRWTTDELMKRIQLSKPDLIVTTDTLKSKHHQLAQNWFDVVDLDLAIRSFPTENIVLEKNEPFYIGFTSGTTGTPKAFIRSQQSWVASFQCNRCDFYLDNTKHVLIPGSLFHSHFLYGAVSTLYLGGSVYIMEQFTPQLTKQFLNQHPISVLYVVPTMIEAFFKSQMAVKQSIQLISSGAKWSPQSKKQIHEVFYDVQMYEFYGASETSFITVLSNEDALNRPETVGKACTGVEIQIRHQKEETQIGKIYVRSELLIDGYITGMNREVETICDAEGFATVNDMGYIDEEGYVTVIGREHNMILYGGINIFPEEIEQVLTTHEFVEEAVVMGVADAYWGQMIVAIIKGNVSRLELKKHCRKVLASYKIPRKWLFVDEMPYTTSGKIARGVLLKQIEREELTYV